MAIPWKGQAGLVESIQGVIAEYKAARNLTPLKVRTAFLCILFFFVCRLSLIAECTTVVCTARETLHCSRAFPSFLPSFLLSFFSFLFFPPGLLFLSFPFTSILPFYLAFLSNHVHFQVCVLGPPGSGKTPYAERLCGHYKLHHIHKQGVIDEAVRKLTESSDRLKSEDADAVSLSLDN